ncbi:hypothetical protein [Mycoplasmopsis gallinacea]|uniref:DUF4013 domain-containing protein n=1 Tax=Mycoplasmopsis gallinacea TaxID=29556 RepID=A0A6H0V174_9BACT|nr:hypothetical protein [Mycoplasmopsis gallinacea]QIW62091.1 hypothetical protein GOQ20_01285 [Mycoplasmopsis gallinacea]
MHNILSFKTKLKKLWTSSFYVWLAGQILGTIIGIISVALIIAYIYNSSKDGGTFQSHSTNGFWYLLFAKFLGLGIFTVVTLLPIAIASVVLTILYIISLMKFSNPEPNDMGNFMITELRKKAKTTAILFIISLSIWAFNLIVMFIPFINGIIGFSAIAIFALHIVGFVFGYSINKKLSNMDKYQMFNQQTTTN